MIQQAFEEHLFINLSIIIVLHCIMLWTQQLKLQSFEHKTMHLNIIYFG